MGRIDRLKAIDFFSGAGGLTYGLRAAGIRVLAGIDIDPSCKETFEKNNKGSVFLERDITKYTPEAMTADIKIKRNDGCLIFSGCAPCQFWSMLHTSKEKSERTKNLILDFQKFIDYFRPGFVIVENVPGISSKIGSPMGGFIAMLQVLGYEVAHGIADMSSYGIPQKRKRFTLLASRVSRISLPTPKNKQRTVRDVIGEKNGFRKIEAGTRDKTCFLHTAAGLSKTNLERLRMTDKDGGTRARWQKIRKYSLRCYSFNEKLFEDIYGRMYWDQPSPTITTKFISISNGRFAHPDEDRAISLREGATLQTFPKAYEFIGSSIASIAKMIGNAVPPEFGKIIGAQIINSLKRV